MTVIDDSIIEFQTENNNILEKQLGLNIVQKPFYRVHTVIKHIEKDFGRFQNFYRLQLLLS